MMILFAHYLEIDNSEHLFKGGGFSPSLCGLTIYDTKFVSKGCRVIMHLKECEGICPECLGNLLANRLLGVRP